MGRSSSKLLEAPNDPLQELQYMEMKRVQQKRKREKELKQIAKLQKKHAKKNKGKRKSGDMQRTSTAQPEVIRSSDAQHMMGSSLNFHNMSCEINQEDISLQIYNKTQLQLDQDLCTFTNNQIALTLQFFGNYESEIVATSEELLAKENEINQNLEEHSILLANPLDVAVAKWIQYKPVHGSDKHNPQLLQPPTMYVVFENIDIARPNDANYDSISPLCKVDMDTEFYKSTPCKEDYAEMLRRIKWKGYVRLKLRESPKRQQQHLSPAGEEVYTDGSSGYSTASGYVSRPKFPATSSVNVPEGDYDYAYITQLNRHQPLSQLKMSSQLKKAPLDVKVLPETCVCSLGKFVDSWYDDTDDENEDDEDDEDEDREAGYSSDDEMPPKTSRQDFETLQAIKMYKLEQERRKILMQQQFLNCKEFMRYFGELLRQKLADKLPIASEDIEEGTYRGASIYTKQYEIIPAIHVPQNAQSWPDCAFQFRIRDRPITTNPLTGQQFQWPTRAMIKRIETFGFHVIPIGYAPKRHRNPFRELEWRIVFPKAERYLEQHLTNTQVKVYIMTKTLLKTYVEPKETTKSLMFAMDHLRMHLFWECERNFTAWPEEFLGEVLIRFITSFMQRLREKCLNDYFIDERNLFESIPEYSLVSLYSILADIIANPLMHLMVAFRNLNFAEQFFPKLNFKRVFENLYENDMFKLKMLAKNARSMVGMENTEDEPSLMVDEGAKGLIGMRQHREKTNGRLRRKTQVMKHNIELKKLQEYESKRMSMESIDVEFFYSNDMNAGNANLFNQGVENLRRTNMLEVFLDQLLLMAEKAIHFRTIHLAKLYLSHARRLCRFYHNYGCDMGAKEYLAAMHTLDEEIDAAQNAHDFKMTPPALPLRASVEPVRPSRSHSSTERSEFVCNSRSGGMTTVELDPTKRSCFGKREQRTDDAIEPTDFKPNRREIVVEKCDRQNKNLEDTADMPDTSKSIKFLQHVVEVHEGAANPIRKPQGYSPVSILRSGGSTTQMENLISDIDADHVENLVDNTIEIEAKHEEVVETEESQSTATNKGSKFSLNRIGTAAGILKGTPIANLKIMKSLASSTEKIMHTMNTDEKRQQLREMLKKKTVQLKGVFNQSSES